MEDEYELIPMSPIRRIEKRVERIEHAGVGNDMIKELVDVVRTNQQIVDDIVKINSEMMNKLGDLSGAVGKMTDKVDEFMNRIEIVGSHEGPIGEETATISQQTRDTEDIDRRLQKLEKRINALLLAKMAKNRMQQPMRRPTV
ncbi:MAG: hypothetical protein HY832_03055 [Candidatus Aenigmarchaeota archaeon]|nr:hypothetical protein [Candidatus Aenigmarchaeota archaeon]